MKGKVFASCIAVFTLLLVLTACSNSNLSNQIVLDYGDDIAFENALNQGENLEGKTVRFHALELKPQSSFGYNIWSGEHLNFISERNPDIQVGDDVDVKATVIKSSNGSWLIEYEKIDNAVIGETTIVTENQKSEDSVSEINPDEINGSTNPSLGKIGAAASIETPDVTVNAAEETKPLEIKENFLYLTSISGDEAYFDFGSFVYNPNDTQIALFPTVTMTAKNGDGSILTTEDSMGSIIMPGDTIIICGSTSLNVNGVSDDKESFEVSSQFGTDTYGYKPVRTSDIVFSNITERSGDNKITGELTNNSVSEVDLQVMAIFRKDGQIVFIEKDYLYNVPAGATKAFQLESYNDWPEHDSIEMTSAVW